MKQTAVEWLANEFYEKLEVKGDGALFNDLVNQAKEIEKQQKGYSEEDLEKAFKVGFTLGYVGDTLIAEKDKCFNRWFKIFKNK
jgi:hypothetical protein